MFRSLSRASALVAASASAQPDETTKASIPKIQKLIKVFIRRSPHRARRKGWHFASFAELHLRLRINTLNEHRMKWRRCWDMENRRRGLKAVTVSHLHTRSPENVVLRVGSGAVYRGA